MSKPWLRSRGYLHLTPHLRVAGNEQWIKAYVADEKKIATHTFSPLIYKTLRERRYKKTGLIDGKPRGHSWVDEKGEFQTGAKDRPIHYPAHLDAVIYGYYATDVLGKAYEALLQSDEALNSCVTAYRRDTGKSNIHHAKEAFDQIKARGNCVAIAMDIKGFFSSLDHQLLKKTWAKLIGQRSLPPDHFNVFKSVTNFSYVDLADFRMPHGGFNEYQLYQYRRRGAKGFFASRDELYEAIKTGQLRVKKNQWLGSKNVDDMVKHRHTKKLVRRKIGIPQGLAISSVLANLYMLPFDRAMLRKVKAIKGVYRRYSDDLVIICDRSKMEEIIDFAEQEIRSLKLKVSSDKTEICVFERLPSKDYLSAHTLHHKAPYQISNSQGKFTYLGFSFDGRKVLIKDKNISRFYRRMKQAIRKRVRQANTVRRRTLNSELIIHKRRLTKRFCKRGKFPTKISKKRSRLRYDKLRKEYSLTSVEIPVRQYGNFYNYVKRANKIMEDDAILRQLRNSGRILERTIKKRVREVQKDI